MKNTHHTHKQTLIGIAKRMIKNDQLTPEEVKTLHSFTEVTKEHSFFYYLKLSAMPLSILLGVFYAMFPEFFDAVYGTLPQWTNLNNELLAGADYIWNIISEPVEKPNIMFHIPNLVLYSFGILGIKNLVDSLQRRSWLDIVLQGQTTLLSALQAGTVRFRMRKGHTVLFVGKGDFIGMQFALNHAEGEAVTLSDVKPSYTDIWSSFSGVGTFSDLNAVLDRADVATAGEYMFFPVQDNHIFLPSEQAYDIPPHKIDLLCQNIRTIEKNNNWSHKRICIIGDRYHKSIVRSEDEDGGVAGTEEIISIETIAKRYQNIDIIDPTELVLKKILHMAENRRIVFRATTEGIREYKTRFFTRLKQLGYSERKNAEGIFTVGYDIFEDQIEQQTICTKLDDYYPIVLSRNVYEALIRNGYKKKDFIYVPDLVLAHLKELAAQQ